ncbi:MAG TPA: hypothetical protein PKA05_12350 [Roseiflexaceae bacterium]|nr:hypothetical protein [Roseiflexaceae bacterium]HMP41167.1 hypothetical protein [Roseiflexaceae bacterium]
MGAQRRFRCRTCEAISPADALVVGAWGDPCCPACGAADVERYRTRWEILYNFFFLYKVY